MANTNLRKHNGADNDTDSDTGNASNENPKSRFAKRNNKKADAAVAKEAKRQALIARVKAAEADLDRRSNRIRHAMHRARIETTEFTTRHPMTALGGAVLLGIAIGSFIPWPDRRRRRQDARHPALAKLRHYAQSGLEAGRDALEEVEERAQQSWREGEAAADAFSSRLQSFAKTAGKFIAGVTSELRERRAG